jgi:hypothetical protein
MLKRDFRVNPDADATVVPAVTEKFLSCHVGMRDFLLYSLQLQRKVRLIDWYHFRRLLALINQYL